MAALSTAVSRAVPTARIASTKRGPAPPAAVSFTALNGGGAAGRSPFTEELRATAKYIAQRGKGMCVGERRKGCVWGGGGCSATGRPRGRRGRRGAGERES
jgi:hypothetical protein